ncbi:MAG: radical SAM family heme chaperone HemW [Bacteroidales bacterium]
MIYVHIPFCRSFCSYCSFYSSTQLRKIPEVLDCIRQEWIRERDSWMEIWRSGQFPLRHTVYLGGGTPSVCATETLGDLLDLLCTDLKRSGMEPAEITVETNPGDLTPDYCRALKELGVNRLSIGVQSFHDEALTAMKRRHTARQATGAFHEARKAGFDNISLDLMFGFPGLDMAQWQETLQQAVALAPEHISAYQLSLEPSSAWGKRIVLPPQETCAEQYALLQEFLHKAGYLQYEVSSFCLPGKESLHNSGYWLRIPYAGLGPAAHSFNGRNRYANVAHLDRYTEGIRKGLPVRTGDRLTPRDVHNEWVMLGLRTLEGLSLQDMEQREGPDAVEGFLKQTAPLVERGFLKRSDKQIRIPAGRLFVSDDIIRDCLLPL